MTDFPFRSRCAVYDAPVARPTPTQADILRNNYRVAERDLTLAEQAFTTARHQLGYANKLRSGQAAAFRALNQARVALRQAEAACLAATDALSTIPGAVDAFIEQAAFIFAERNRLADWKRTVATAIIAASDAGKRGVQIGRDWYAAFNARHARAWLADASYPHFKV